LPDQEAIEVALEDLSDVSASEPSTETNDGLEQPEQQEADAAIEPAKVESEDSEKETETKTQRRRRLRREREEKSQAEIARLKTENERLKTREKGLVRPDPTKYTSDAEYHSDLAAYKVRKQDLQTEYERIDADYGSAEDQGTASFNDAVSDFSNEGTEKYPDFAEKVIKSDLPFTAIMVETLMDSDMGADTAYYMAQNPNQVKKIAEMPPIAQARAIFELESKVKAKQAPAQSKAPAPVKPVRGGSSASQSKPITEMSMAEYAAHRHKQMEAQR